MEEVFENDIDPKPLKEKKVRKKRVVSEDTKKRLRAQLKKGRATALANRKKKLAEKQAKLKSPPKVVEVEEEPPTETPTKEVSNEEFQDKKNKKYDVTPPPSPKKEVREKKPPTPKIKEEPRVVNTPPPAPRLKPSPPIAIPPPLEYQSTFKKMRRKW
tara:strand:- start:253 stop:726 length:474 start_codon:yes stop_codon:yes gene_type:complete